MARTKGRPLGSDGARAYRALHGTDAGPPHRVGFRLPRGELVDLYRLTAIEGDRLVDEGFGREWVAYRHDFAPGHGPHLAADADGWGFLIGGRYEITDHGIEDNAMRRYGSFVPMSYHFRSNPEVGSAGRGLLALGAGLVGGVALAALIQAAPESRVSANVKDGISVAVALAAVMLPGPGTGRMVGGAIAASLALGVANRRFAISDKVAAWVDARARSVYARLLPAPSGGGGTTPPERRDGAPLPSVAWGN